MSERIPRWGLPEVDFIEIDPESVKSSIITGYEKASGRTLAQGDPVRLFLLSVAAEIINLRLAVNHAAQQNLLTYAKGEYLDALGVLLDVYRLAASPASAMFEFSLSQSLASAFVIPKGFEISNGVVTFATDEILTINPGEIIGTVGAHCTTPGVAGNGFLPGQITTIVSPLAYLESAKNTSETAGGAGVESDEDFAERIRLRPNSFSVAGPVKAYEFHAKSVNSAIMDVSIHSPTPGIVNVYSLLEGGVLPNEALLKDIETYLNAETIRPLTDEVHALVPTVKEYSIHVDYYIYKEDANKVAAIQQRVNNAVEEYRLWQQGKIGRDITPNKLISLLEQAGVARLESSAFTPSAFEEVSAYQVAQCREVVVNYKGLKDI